MFEFAPYGNLGDFLRARRESFTKFQEPGQIDGLEDNQPEQGPSAQGTPSDQNKDFRLNTPNNPRNKDFNYEQYIGKEPPQMVKFIMNPGYSSSSINYAGNESDDIDNQKNQIEMENLAKSVKVDTFKNSIATIEPSKNSIAVRNQSVLTSLKEKNEFGPHFLNLYI